MTSAGNVMYRSIGSVTSGLGATLKRGGRAFLWLVVLGLQPVASPAQQTTVPLHHQVYPLLNRGETLKLFSSYHLRVLPLTRTEVLNLLREMKRHERRLSEADRRLLRQMLAEFTDPAPGEPAPPGSEIHAYRYDEGQTQLFLDLRVQQTFRFSRNRLNIDSENISETLGSVAVRGRLSASLFFAAEARNTMVLGQPDLIENFDPQAGPIQVTVGAAAFKDQAIGYFAGKWGRLGVLIGRNQIGWGSWLQEQLGLSGSNEPMDLIQLHLDWQRFRFSYFHATLQGIADRRYLAGHRLDLWLSPGIQLGAYETVVYGGRGPEPGYLNPVVPYQIIEHQLGDRDNNTFGVDFNLFPLSGLRIFGEIFVDDLSFDKPLGTYWGNKLAYLAGLHWVRPFKTGTAEFTFTYTRVDPFVFTHYDSLNIYAHYGQSLGTRLGPNADRLLARVAYQPHRDVRLSLTFHRIRKGEGALFGPFRPREGESKGFLRGTLEFNSAWTLALRNQIRRDIFLGLNVTMLRRDNAGRIGGKRVFERYARFFLDVNY